MILYIISYDGNLQEKVKDYNAIPDNKKSGDYWENSKDKTLIALKKHIKDHYLLVQKHTCAYCKQSIEVNHNAAWDIDHIIPKDTHPKFLFEGLNLCISCKDCNNIKSNKNVLTNPKRKTLPIKKEDYLIIHPHLDSYTDHISLITNNFYLPKTEKGRHTVEICGLLRFLYNYQNKENISLEIKQKISELNNKLMNSTNPTEEHFLLSCISDLAHKGREESKIKALEKIFSNPKIAAQDQYLNQSTPSPLKSANIVEK